MKNRTPDQRKKYCTEEYKGLPEVKKKCKVRISFSLSSLTVIFAVREQYHGHVKIIFSPAKSSVIA